MWSGEYSFVLQNLVLKDFKIRYRNMSLGVGWSLLNPLIMMGVLTLVFSKFFPNGISGFPVYLLCGLVPFNFFSLSWSAGTNSLIDSAGLIKRVPIPREVVPIASVLANCLHLLIQIGVLLTFTLLYRYGVNREWVWLPAIWGLEVIFVLGLVLACSAIDVYLRDMRYLVESSTTILFYLVPIFYSAEKVPTKYVDIYQWNPLAAIVLALRRVLMEAQPPGPTLMWKLSLGSLATLTVGWTIFRSLQRRFYDHL
jgi:ABC-type polysaccharide/polyol phosphate export permease